MELNQGAQCLLLYQVPVGCKYVLLAVSRDLRSTKKIKRVPNKPALKDYVMKVMRVVRVSYVFLHMTEQS